MFKKAYDEKWPFATIDVKGDTCSSVMKWLDWWTVECDQQTASSAAWNQ